MIQTMINEFIGRGCKRFQVEGGRSLLSQEIAMNKGDRDIPVASISYHNVFAGEAIYLAHILLCGRSVRHGRKEGQGENDRY